jgi:hypothetical protein
MSVMAKILGLETFGSYTPASPNPKPIHTNKYRRNLVARSQYSKNT